MANNFSAFFPAIVASSFIALTATAGGVFGYSAAILCLAAAALSSAIFLIYLSLAEGGETQSLSVEEALSLVSPTAEEEEKRAVLRALNDLQFERSMGKISEQDYQEGAREYRLAASRLIAQSDLSLADRKKAALERFKNYADAHAKEEKQVSVEKVEK